MRVISYQIREILGSDFSPRLELNGTFSGEISPQGCVAGRKRAHRRGAPQWNSPASRTVFSPFAK